MKKRRSLTKHEQALTLAAYMRKHNLSQKAFCDWLFTKDIVVSPQYLNDVINNRRGTGPRFRQIFRVLTGVKLVDGLIEEER